MVAETEKQCSAKATSTLLHRGSRASGGRNVFLAPDGFGSGAVFGALGPLLSSAEEVFVYALNSPFLKNKPDALNIPTIEELAAIYVGEIKRRQPEGPYLLGGYSVGGAVAYEAARQLLEDGNEVEKLFLTDTACPTFVSTWPDSLCEFLDSIAQGKNGESSRGKVVENDHFTLARQQVATYKVSKLPGRKLPQAVLVSAKEGADKQDTVRRPEVKHEGQRITDWFLDDRLDDGSLGWDELLGSVSVVCADGNHFSMMTPAKVNTWASTLADLLGP